MSLQEQVDKDFTLALRRATIGRMWARLRRDQAVLQGLVCLEELRRFLGAAAGVYRGLRTVSSGQIVGSSGLCAEFDRNFLPIKAGVGERWKQIDRAFHRGEELPPVSLYKIGGAYFVLDSDHRVSVYLYHGVRWLEAHVTEYRAPPSTPLPSESRRARTIEEPKERRGSKEAANREDPRMQESAFDFEDWKQRREEMLREVEQNRLAKTLRESRKPGGSGRASSLVWELKRSAGRLYKLFRSFKKVD